MRVVLLGNHLPGIYALEYLLDHGADVLVVVPFGKKVQAWHASLFDYAQARGIKRLYNPQDVNSPAFVEKLRAFAPDVLLSVYYNQIIKQEILALPPQGCFNIHPALLPQYRGVAPLIWAIINGEKHTGVTLHKMAERVDAGEIVMQRKIRIQMNDTGYSLHHKAGQTIREMIPEFFTALRKGWIKFQPQEGKGSLYTSRTPRVNELDFKNNTAERNFNIVRALTRPLAGAYFYFRGRKNFLWKAQVATDLDPAVCREYGGLLFYKGEVYAPCRDNTFLKLLEVESALWRAA